MTCKLCKQPRHNKASCPQRSNFVRTSTSVPQESIPIFEDNIGGDTIVQEQEEEEAEAMVRIWNQLNQ
ncbi:hypothetical protein CRYUN_Cryun23aG0032700 [Craigia yunnanensis]